MIKKNIAKFIPNKFLKIYLTIKHLISNYKTISKFAELERKVKKNVELNDIEFEEFEEFLSSIPANFQTYVDIGAADGVNASCTLKLARDKNWSGVCFEFGDISNISYIYRNFENVSICKVKVVPDNIANLLKSYNIPKYFGFLNLDIDSYDYFVIKKILESNYRPYLISMEINEKIPPPLEFYVKFDDNFQFVGDHFYGCSLTSANNLLTKFGYKLKHLTRNNALFLNSEFFDFNERSVAEIYNQGYVNLKNRKEIFWYNNDIDNVLDLPIEEAMEFIKNKFIDYKGKFHLSLS